MAHQIDETSIGRASYASTQREWHGLGELMLPGQTVEQWQERAGMLYRVQRSFVRYATIRPDGVDTPESQARLIEGMRTIDDQHVLFRSDTGAPLGIVSDGYKVVQPSDVLDFFREWADMGGLTIESAGVLFGGKRYFATAKLADGVSVGAESENVATSISMPNWTFPSAK